MKKLILLSLLLCSCEAKISINSEQKYSIGSKVLVLSIGIPGIITYYNDSSTNYEVHSSDLTGKKQILICKEFELRKMTDEEFNNFFKERNIKTYKI